MFKNYERCVQVSGGLGAQLLAYNASLKLAADGFNISYDLSYFEQESKIKDKNPHLSFFPWCLDYYGINAETLAHKCPNWIHRLFLRHVDFEFYMRDGGVALHDAQKKVLRCEFLENFPIKPCDLLSVRKALNSGPPACVVHIRQGDFKKVASLQVSLEQLFNSVTIINRFDVSRFLIVSDEFFDLNQLQARFPNCSFEIINMGLFQEHALMREAPYLITSNSQFSLSAALLNRHGTILYPRYWIKRNDRLVSTPTGFGDWVIE
jgi:hypothetical protein